MVKNRKALLWIAILAGLLIFLLGGLVFWTIWRIWLVSPEVPPPQGTPVSLETLLPSETPWPTATLAVPLAFTPTATTTAAGPEETSIPTATQSPPVTGCVLSVQLRKDNAELVLKYQPQIVASSDTKVAAQYFGSLGNSTRLLLGASLAELQKMMGEMDAAGAPYDGLAYDLEGWEQTPQSEKDDPVGASKQAADLAHSQNKTLVMVPGLKFMDQNPQAYSGMAANADGWLIQSQRRQGMYPPGTEYRNAILEVVNLVRAGNAAIPIWVQLSVTPGGGAPLSLDTLLAYRNAILGDVDGISIFDLMDPNRPKTLEGLLAAVCP